MCHHPKRFSEDCVNFNMHEEKETEKSEKPINPEDAMKLLEEKIALVKQRGTWDGVDVDKFMDEVRGREPEKPVPNDLEEYASRTGFDYVDNIVQEHPGHRFNDHDVEYAYRDGIIAGAKWQADHTPLPEDTVLFNKGVEEGKRQMMENAVEGEVCIPNVWVEHKEGKELVVRAEISKELGFKFGEKVRVIVLPKEDSRE
jgi:hypothetical protein